jgi:hypothetical protein
MVPKLQVQEIHELETVKPTQNLNPKSQILLHNNELTAGNI